MVAEEERMDSADVATTDEDEEVVDLKIGDQVVVCRQGSGGEERHHQIETPGTEGEEEGVLMGEAGGVVGEDAGSVLACALSCA